LTNNCSIYRFIIGCLLIIVVMLFAAPSVVAQQDTLSVAADSLALPDDSLKKPLGKPRIIRVDDSMGEDPVFYSAQDSIYTDLRTKKVHLYRDAKVTFGTTTLTSDYMVIDLDGKEVMATFTLDEEGKRRGEPVFEDGGQEVKAASIRFNFETKKAKIEETRIRQEESFLYMETAKRHANEEIHFRNGRFSTCDLDYPHFHFQLTKAVLVPNKRIVTGASNLWLNGVPTPLTLPFGFFPTGNKERTRGIVFPQIIPVSQYGFGVQDLGFYTPLGKNFETTFMGTLFSRGTWGLGNTTSYNVRYRYQGSARLDYQRLKQPFPGKNSTNKITLTWMHNQDAKSNPYWRFGANVNFISDNQTQNTLDPQNSNYFSNTFQSSITLNRLFPGKPYNLGMKVGVSQSTQTKNMFFDLPKVNFNVSRIYPFKVFRKNPIGGERWYEKIGLIYGLEARNQGNVHDSLFSSSYSNLIMDRFLNGVRNNFELTTTLKAFNGTLNFTPSITYTNFINFQSTERRWDSTTNQTVLDSVSGVFMGQNLSVRINATNAIYSMYRMIGLKNVRFRNVTRPNVGFTYIPNMTNHRTKFAGQNGNLVTYSPFENSLYREGPNSAQGLITFGINSVTDMKMPSKRDSTGMKRIALIEGLSLTGRYDILADSMNLSNMDLSIRLRPLQFLSIVAGATFSPYDWDDATNAVRKDYALSARGKLGRFVNYRIATDLTLTNKEGQKILNETQSKLQENWTADFDYYALFPNQVIDFRIPWKLNFSHNLNWQVDNPAFNPQGKGFRYVQTLSVSGELSLTARWLIASRAVFDINTAKFTTMSVDIHRNLHCWKLSFFWIPVGGNRSFLLRIAADANMLRDVKWEFRKPPIFF
jgi:hypothetical protein